MKTNDSEIERMEALARKVSQAEAPIPQHIENIRNYNDPDLPTTTPHHRVGRGVAIGGGGWASHHIYIY